MHSAFCFFTACSFLVLCPAHLRFLSCLQLWFLCLPCVILMGPLSCAWTPAYCAAFGNCLLGSAGAHLLNFLSLGDHRLVPPVVKSLLTAAWYILVAYCRRATYFILARSWNPLRESRLLNTWKTRSFMMYWERIEKLWDLPLISSRSGKTDYTEWVERGNDEKQ